MVAKQLRILFWLLVIVSSVLLVTWWLMYDHWEKKINPDALSSIGQLILYLSLFVFVLGLGRTLLYWFSGEQWKGKAIASLPIIFLGLIGYHLWEVFPTTSSLIGTLEVPTYHKTIYIKKHVRSMGALSYDGIAIYLHTEGELLMQRKKIVERVGFVQMTKKGNAAILVLENLSRNQGQQTKNLIRLRLSFDDWSISPMIN